MSDEVLVERRGAVQVITINRPQARNALNGAVAAGIRDAADVMATKQIAVHGADWSAAERWDRAGALTAPVLTSADAREGAQAFAEKRDPVWRGR